MSNSEPILLGLMAPFSGLVEMYGAEIVMAAQIACAAINNDGGVLGRTLELRVADDGSLPPTAIPAAHRLVDEGCVALIGNLLSNSRIAIAGQVAEPRRIPYLNFSFYEGSIAARHFFHFAALPNQQIERMIPWMLKAFGPKMFFAGNNYEWPRGSIDAAKRILCAVGGDILGEEYLPFGASTTEIDLLLAQVRNSGADVFVPYFAGSDQVALLTQFTEMGLKQRVAVVMGHYDEVMVSRLPPHVREGFFSTNTYFMSVNTRANQDFLAQLARQPEISGLWPEGNGIISNFGEGAYLCVHAFAAAANAAQSLDSAALVTALEQVSILGPQGRITMDKATHHAQVNSYLARCRSDGGFDIIESFGSIAPEIPARYRSTMNQVAQPEAARTVGAPALTPPSTAYQILNVADVAVIATDTAGIILEASPQASDMFGYHPHELAGMSVHILLPPHLRAGHIQHLAGFLDSPEMSRQMRARGNVTGYRKDGTFFPLEASIAKVSNGTSWLLVVTLQDITERKRTEEKFLWQTTHDALTGLPNRALIRERLNNALQWSRRRNNSVALLFIDLDGFKAVNDSYGYKAGDELLKIVAARLTEQVRRGDITLPC